MYFLFISSYSSFCKYHLIFISTNLLLVNPFWFFFFTCSFSSFFYLLFSLQFIFFINIHIFFLKFLFNYLNDIFIHNPYKVFFQYFHVACICCQILLLPFSVLVVKRIIHHHNQIHIPNKSPYTSTKLTAANLYKDYYIYFVFYFFVWFLQWFQIHYLYFF